MFAIILAAILSSHGTPARAIDGQYVVIEGRPECHGEALYNDPTKPIVVCTSATMVVFQ